MLPGKRTRQIQFGKENDKDGPGSKQGDHNITGEQAFLKLVE